MDKLNACDIYENEKKEVNFLNSQIMLFNFEDDTFRPVIVDLDTDLEYIKKLYDECNIPLEIESTPYYVKYGNNPFGEKMLCDIDIRSKKKFIDTYLPSLLKFKELTDKIAWNEEEFYFSNCKNVVIEGEKKVSKHANCLFEQLGLNIPENIISKNIDESVVKDKKTEYIKKLFPKYEPPTSYEKDDNIVAFNSHFKSEILRGEYYPYNVTYNVLYPKFADNYSLVKDPTGVPFNNSYSITDEKTKNATNISIVLNVKYWHTKVLKNPFSFHVEMLNKHNEYGFLNLFSLPVVNEKIINYIYEKLDNIIFDNANDLNKILNLLSDFIHYVEEDDYNSECKDTECKMEEEQVQDFLNLYYEITNDEKDKIKLSTICNIIKSSSLVSLKKNASSTFQNRLTQYLTNLGWKRKYFPDGFYYYGIKDRFYEDTKKNDFGIYYDDGTKLEAIVNSDI